MNRMKKEPFVTKTQLDEIVKEYPTPFHLYDEKGIREKVKELKEAFAWNKEYKEYTNRSRYYAHDMGRDVRCGVSWSF